MLEAKRSAAESGRPVLVSSTERLTTDIDPVSLFAGSTRLHNESYFWGVPTNRSWTVGAGIEANVTVEGSDRFERAKASLREIFNSSIIDGEDPIFIGGFRFDIKSQTNGNWAGFYDGLLSLPRIIVSCHPPNLSSTLNVFVRSETDIESSYKGIVSEITSLLEQTSTPETAGSTAEVVEETTRAQWQVGVDQALQAVKKGVLRKVTLARMAKARSQDRISPSFVLRSLVENYPQCHVFAIRRAGASFVGASPEELVDLHGRSVNSTCLAGSAPRGISEYEDSHFSEGLLGSAKEREEHEIVVDWVSNRMQSLCENLHWNESPEVFRLGNVQHLATQFVGTSRNDVTVLDFVNALHPTPAVGGMPLEPALEMIRRVETFDRGWYTGPVGWVDRQGFGEFAIALRCALIRERDAFLYAGAGIVSASDADHEYEETTLKLKPLLTALGVR
jgi:isochorismate synthase